MKRIILVTYRNGSTVSIDVPENYYVEKYKKKPEAKLHKIFKELFIFMFKCAIL